MVSSVRDRLLLSVEPGELAFPYELRKQTSCQLRLSNNTQQPVAFKFMTTARAKFSVWPNLGVILARSTCEITVRMQAPKKATPDDLECKDKFMIRSVVTRDGTTNDNVRELFKEPEDAVEETKLRVRYIFRSQKESSNSEGEKVASTQQIIRPLDVRAQELKSPFCMRVPKDATSGTGIECKDKFLIKSVITKGGTSEGNASALFRGPVDAVEEHKLRVTYFHPSHTESSDSVNVKKESLVNASKLQDGRLNHSEDGESLGMFCQFVVKLGSLCKLSLFMSCFGKS